MNALSLVAVVLVMAVALSLISEIGSQNRVHAEIKKQSNLNGKSKFPHRQARYKIARTC